MITRSSIAFEDFVGSSIAPQVMPPWWTGKCTLKLQLQGSKVISCKVNTACSSTGNHDCTAGKQTSTTVKNLGLKGQSLSFISRSKKTQKYFRGKYNDSKYNGSKCKN